jgi:hypothetical protein
VTDAPLQIVPSLLVVPEVSAIVIAGLTKLTLTVADAVLTQAVVELITVTV